MSSISDVSKNSEYEDGVTYLDSQNALHIEAKHFNKTNQVSDLKEINVEQKDRFSDDKSFYEMDKNKPETFLNSDDLEKVTDSQIFPQKRFFRFLHTKKMPPIPHEDDRKVFPKNKANLLSQIFFWWMVPLIRVGYKRTLQPNDLWKVDQNMTIEKTYDDFMYNMNIYLNESKLNYLTSHPNASSDEIMDNAELSKFAIVKALFWTFRWDYSKAIIFVVMQSCASCFTPMLTKKLINFVQLKAFVPETPVNNGIGYAIGACLLMLVNGLLFNHFFLNSQTTGVQVKSVLIKAILDKSFKLSGYAKYKYPNGKITSIMSTDLSRLELAVAFQPFLVSFPFSVIICLVLLIINLGPIALVGIGMFFAVVLTSSFGFKKLVNVRIKANGFTDSRVTAMREILTSIKIIKFYAWEDAYEKNIQSYRSNEIDKVKTMQYTRTFLTVLGIGLASLSSMVTFLAMYKVNNGGRNPANIFSSLSLFQVLSIQVFFLPMALSTGIDGMVGLTRVQKFLQASEAPNTDTEIMPEPNPKIAYKMINASFEWDSFDIPNSEEKNENDEVSGKEEKLLDLHNTSFKGFKNLNLEIYKGELIIITGSIGTGKSSLLNALAGFMRQTSGEIRKNGDLLLCGYPWVQNATVRDNILFGSPYIEDKYKDVLRVCSLQTDLDLLPAGDRTEIGERGITLSGGQKARINLARSIYKTMDIYLFDDVLSAVDSRVGKFIMDECIINKLNGKTRILATHQLSLIEKASRIIFLGTDGSVDFGSVEELKKRNPGFVNLMEFSSQGKNDSTNENESVPILHKEISSIEKQLSRKSTIKSQLENDGQLVTKEERAVNGISFRIYKEYIIAGIGKSGMLTLALYFFFIVGTTFMLLFSSVWLSFWTEDKFKAKTDGFYIGLYVFFVIGSIMFLNGQFILLCYIGITASKWLNLKAVKRLLHTPMSFMDTTPIGRILNRFTKDTDCLDNELTESLKLFIYQGANIIGVIIMCIIYLPWFAIAVPFLLFFFVMISDHFQASGREIKRLEAVQRSFVYNNFNEVLGGMDTIKAYKSEKRFLLKSDFLIDKMNEAGFLVVGAQRWVAISLDLIAVTFAMIIALLSVTRQFNISASSVGVLLTYVLQLPGLLNSLLRTMTQTENDMNSAERLVSYATKLPTEAPYRIPETKPSDSWPTMGQINFQNVSLAYRPGLPLVLKNVSININSGEKIGICGRTGAGKSTIMSALYRLCELHTGNITIDDVDISKIGLYDLRSKLSIIPQDPVLFKGSIRKNLDPFDQCSDDELWNALVRGGAIDSNYIDKVKNQKKGLCNNNELHKFHLHQNVEDDGSNFSLGERQFLALSRALVRQPKILILDEATSSVDYETDSKIQNRIAEEFGNCTILCIAHRLKTILNYNRILVLDKGEVKEFDTPLKLYLKSDSIFREMCDRSGITKDDFSP